MAEDMFDLDDRRRLELGLNIRERIAVELTKDGKERKHSEKKKK
jgi:hypothetical protein